MKKRECLRLCAVAGLLIFQTAGGSDVSAQVKWNGDLRYRHETSDVENSDQRNRERIRARLGMTADVNEDVTVKVQFASGGDSPVSTNQTLDNGFSSKGINLDLAYFSWSPEAPMDVTVMGGKMKNAHVAVGGNEILWDSDLRPEGMAAELTHAMDAVHVFANGGYYWIDERKSGNDAILIGGQAGIEYGDGVCDIMLGAGYFDYQNLKHTAPIYDAADSFGNTVRADGSYRYDYNLAEVFGELTSKRFGLPVNVYADAVINIADDVDDNMAWIIGVNAGDPGDPGEWGVGYNYRRVEADAVLGAFTSSDFIGGGSDGAGHQVSIDYCAAESVTFSGTYFISDIGVDNGIGHHLVQLDAKFKW